MATGLTKHQIEIISQTAIKEYEKRIEIQQKEQRERNVGNTGLLLKNYRKLKELCEGLDEQAEEYSQTVLSLEVLTLESLEKHRFKTLKMLNHVDKMLVAYKFECNKGTPEEHRRYKILESRYLASTKLSVRDICELMAVEQGTVYRDTKIAISEMSVLLFGLDAINFK